MRRLKGETVDFLQNITIAVLAVSFVFLFSQTEIFQLSWQSASGRFRLFSGSTLSAERDLRTERLDAPIRLAVTGRFGRRANLILTTAGEEFQPVGRVLSAALADGGAAEEIPQEDFLRALDGVSLYCDFLYPLPLSVLAGLTGGHTLSAVPSDAAPSGEAAARTVVLASEDSGTALYLWDGKRGYLRRSSTVTREELESTAGRYAPSNAAFAMDLADNEAARGVTPLSLLPDRLPRLPVLSASGGQDGGNQSGGGTERLLTALRFNPLTNYRYTESNGTQVIVENGRSVRVRGNGSVYYQSGGRTDVEVPGGGPQPTAWEAAVGCAALLKTVLGDAAGAQALYLREVRRNGTQTVLRYDYRVEGAPVRFADGTCAAEVTLEGRSVSTLELRPRRYTITQTDSPVLPLAQALGIAGLRPGRELSLAYCDTGGERVSAQWISE